MTVQRITLPSGKVVFEARGRRPNGDQYRRRFPRQKLAAEFDTTSQNEKYTGMVVVDRKRAVITLDEYQQGWRARQTAATLGTLDSHRQALAVRLVPFVGPDGVRLGDKALRDIEHADIDAFVNWLVGKYEKETARVSWVYVKKMFTAACHWAHIPNPCADPAKPGKMLRLPSSAKPPRQPIEVPTFEEIERITANLPKQVAALAWLGARTGLRPGELLGLDLANIEPFNLPLRTVKEGEPTTGALRVCQQMDCRAHEIVARLKTPKSWRTVKIGAGTVALILEHLAANGRTAAEGGLLFRTLEGNPMAHHYMNKRWAAAVRKAGLRRIRTHDMRHYFASALIEDGASPIFVRDAMGHSRTEETTDTYGHLFPDWDDKVRDTIDTRIARDKASALEAAAEAEK